MTFSEQRPRGFGSLAASIALRDHLSSIEHQMNTNFRAFENVRICSISAHWVNSRAFRKKVRVLRLAEMAGPSHAG